jgi:DNA replication and repair protein RecF
VAGGDVDQIRAELELKLQEAREREAVTKTSVVGPHRDEVEFEIKGFPVRTHGSQGEQRSAAISLKLAVFQILKETRGFAPILLLDEAFAELDPGRSERLIKAFDDFGQMFLTTAVHPPQSLLERARRFRIANGEIANIS